MINNGPSTNPLGSGGKLPGSRAMRIESRKGILSRKSSVNKNSFYKQKSKDTQPNRMYGGNGSPSGISGMGRISGNVNGSSSHFNKNAPPGHGSSHGLPGVGSSGGGMSKPGGPGFGYKYNAGGIGGGMAGIGSATNKSNENPYVGGAHNYQENSQGAQGSIGSSGSGVRGAQNMGSRGGGDFVLPSVSNKIAMGGMRGLPGMPGSKGGSKHGNNIPKVGGSYMSNQGAGYNKQAAPGIGGLNAFNVPKYGQGGIGGGSGIGGGIGLSGGLGSYGS